MRRTGSAPWRRGRRPLSWTVLLDADLCIVGAGFTGLWAALAAKELDPARDVVVLEADVVGGAASGRNGGFAEPSLTHGLANGLTRFPSEIEVLEDLGHANFSRLRADVRRYGIDCDLEPTGTLAVAMAEHEVPWLREEAELLARFGVRHELLDAAEAQEQIGSPRYRGALWSKDGSAILNPTKLTSGLHDAAIRAGVRFFENTRATSLHAEKATIRVAAEAGQIKARRVLLATSAFPPLLRALRRYIAPVYDYVLVTEPLDRESLDSLRWTNRQGVSDLGNQFHYYRLTADDRLLFGGYDAVYRYGGPVRSDLDFHDPTFARLSQHLAFVFPQLHDVRISHCWGGAIDTCSRFSVFFGTAHKGRVAYAAGYTGLGVAASRFGARTALALLDGRATDATELQYVRRRPLPFPPEPARTAAIQLTRNRLAAADRNQGRRGLWLRTLDQLGLGFDS